MKADQVLDMINGARDQYVAAAIASRKAAPKKAVGSKRVWLIAAAIAMAALLVGCGIVYVLKMQDLKLGDQQVTQEYWDDENKTMAYETVSQQVLTFSGLKGTPNYEAAKEWYEFKKTYDPDYTIYNQQRDAGTLDWGPAEYSLYNSYTQEMRDKVDEINQQYGLKLRGKKVNALNADSLYAYLNMDGVLLPGAKAETDDFNAAFYDGGWFHTDMHMTLTDSPDWPYQFLCSLYYNPKDCFDTTVCELNDTADWQEWNYTTKSGDNVLVIRSASAWYSWVFFDRPDATVTLRIETIREVYSDDSVEKFPMTDDQLKEVLDCIDFKIKPQPGDESLLAGPAASRELTQTSNGYTVTVKDMFTDGKTMKIALGITAPEDVDLEQYMNANGRGGISFDFVGVTPNEEIHSHGGGASYGSRADGDGKANTIDYDIEMYEAVENGVAIQEGSTWKLYLENLVAKEWDRENGNYKTLWEMEGGWSFEITMDNGDWTEIEFVGEPITTNVCYGWDVNGNDVFRDETITSLKLRAGGASYVSPSALGQLDFANYKKEQYPKVVLKDGREIDLRGDLAINDPETDGSWIPMDEVDHLELIDGTVLTPVSTVAPVSRAKQTIDGYSLTLKSAVTDGRTARIILGVTAPEGTVLSRKDGIYDMFGAEFGNFGNYTVLQASDGRSWRDYGGGMETMRGLEDGDGKENTVDILYITEMKLPNEGVSEIYFDSSLTWTLHIEGITMDRSEYPEKILTQTVPLFSNEDTWELPFTFDEATDTREIEFLTKPKTIKAKSGGSGDSLQDLTMESFRLSALQLRVDWKDDIAGDLFDYAVEPYKIVTVVMKDGTRVPLDGSGDYTISDYVNPIDLDQVDHVELHDGTPIYPTA